MPAVTDAAGQEIFVISAKAQVIRVTLEDFRVVGRDTQGVIIWRDREPDDYVASITAFQESSNLRSNGSENGNQPANGDGEADAS